MEKFSVLMSVYFKEDPNYFKSSLESILINQTLRPTELVLICDGDLTPGLEVVIDDFKRLFPDILRVYRKENGGLGRALDFGLSKCSNDIVARMDTDDVAKSNRFEKQIHVFKVHPEYDVVGAWVDEFNEDISNVISTRVLPEYSDDIYEFAKKRNPINHPVAMFRKMAVEAAGGYKHFPLFEDYYLWVRMLLNGSKFYNIPESLLYFRSSPEMFKRRGGFSYACVETRYLWHIHQLGLVGFGQTCMNIPLRFFARVIPNKFRGLVYKRLLR